MNNFDAATHSKQAAAFREILADPKLRQEFVAAIVKKVLQNGRDSHVLKTQEAKAAYDKIWNPRKAATGL